MEKALKLFCPTVAVTFPLNVKFPLMVPFEKLKAVRFTFPLNNRSIRFMFALTGTFQLFTNAPKAGNCSPIFGEQASVGLEAQPFCAKAFELKRERALITRISTPTSFFI